MTVATRLRTVGLGRMHGHAWSARRERGVNLDFIREISDFDFKNTIPVCVFVNSNNSFIREVISFFEKPIIQFHGDETQIFCDSFDTHYWKAIRISNQESFGIVIQIFILLNL